MSEVIELTPPRPDRPMLVHMVSDAVVPDNKGKEDRVWWIVGQDHPYVPQAKIVRMFADDAGVEVYSVTKDGNAGMRDIIPSRMVRLAQEAMSIEIFADELDKAEYPEDEPDAPGDASDDVPEAPEPQQATAPSAPNGQPSA